MVLALVILGMPSVGFADYPLVSHRYLADPTGLEYNGQLYIYCSNDDDNSTNGGYSMHSIVCLSTSDLKNWTDHGVVLQVPRDVSWATYSWAPSVITNNGLFYMYFGNNASGIGVATSSVPTGPFKDAKGTYLINSSTPGAATANQWYFDPDVFVDSNNIYLYFGGQYPTNARVIMLNSNMTSVSGSASTMTASNFFEASYMHKRGSTYYYSYSIGATIQYETNSNPTSGFVYEGTVLPNPPDDYFNNNHHSFFTYLGAWYCAYHNRYLATVNGLPTGYKRNVCLDVLNYNSDGTMQQVVCTSNGLAQLQNLNPFNQVEAETMAGDSGIYTETCSEGGMDVTSLANGSWIKVQGVNFGTSGSSNFTARVASATSGGNIELHLDGTNGYLIGICPVPVTGGGQTWTTVSCAVSNAAAKNVHDLYLRFTGSSSSTNLFNVNWYQFQVVDSNAAASTTQFILKTSDVSGSTSFSSIGNWVTNGTSNAATAPPGPGGAYNTGPFVLRSPTTGGPFTFAGDSLTISPGGFVYDKGSGAVTMTVNNCTNNGSGFDNAIAGSFTLFGNMFIPTNNGGGAMSTGSGNSSGTDNRAINCGMTISGSGNLTNWSSDANWPSHPTAQGTVNYTGNNTAFTGAQIAIQNTVIQISSQANLGGNPASFNPAQLLLNNGTLAANNNLALNNANSGITLGSGDGGFSAAGGSALTISNPITGPGALTFNGPGSLILAATNTYSGATIITGGSVSILSVKSGSGNISLTNGTTLDVSASGTQITPAVLTLGGSASVTLAFDNITNAAIAPIAAGSISAGAPVNIRVQSGAFAVGQSYPLLTWTSGAAPAVILGLLNGAGGNLSTNGNTIQLNVTSTIQAPVASVKFEAESGTLGSDWAISNSSSPVYITITTQNAGNYPSNATRVATYTVAFPTAGTYQLYAHVLVGPGGGSSDSLFYGNGFGAKNPTNSSDWILVNGLFNVGFTASSSVVTGGGTAGTGVWKWINLSQFAPGATFTVPPGNLVQTFQIGGRETGLDIDSFVFGLNGMTFTVSNLDAGVDGTPPSAGVTTVNWTDVRQRMDGFGGGVVFLDAGLDPVTSADMDTLYDTNNANQLGLTLLRVRIDPTTNWTTALSDAQLAVARGARVFATPWTPPATMKTNNNIVGGALTVSQYANYASYLNLFAGYMRSNGVPLAAVSVQNEPDANVTYESCGWTPAQLQAFCHTNASAITNAPVIMPESEGFNTSYSDPTLNDPVAVTNVSIIAGHLYGVTTISDYPNAHNNGKPTWMTEYLVNDQSIGAAVATAQQIHDCLTIGNMSAYVWWKTLGDSNGLVNASGVPQPRGFVMAQFSRFVRPGFNRIATANNDGTLMVAFRNTNSTTFAIVAINPTAFPLAPTFNLQNFPAVASVAPWITSSSLSLAAQSSVAVTNSTFAYTLPGMSVVTFVGQANSPPLLAAIANQTINAGVTLTVTNAASDPDLPAQSLTFSLLNGPTNATLTTINPANAVFAWRPTLSQVGTTNLIIVEVADNGAPVLSATNNFTVTVNPLSSLPSINSIAFAAGGLFSLAITGPMGPDYTVQTSTNLFNWQSLFTSNSPVTPFTLTVTNMNDPDRFYRIQIGP